jgi:protocatechuate 3,4-dioxygenase beta subunit
MLLALPLLLALQAATPDRCVIEGRVLKAGSGDPLNKANLTLFRQDARDRTPRFAVSDDAGRFVFRDLEPGRYQLSVNRNGYVGQQYGQRGQNRSGAVLSLERGQQVRDVVFRLQPQAVITGRVTDEDGDPVPNVFIQVMRMGYMEGRRQLLPAAGRASTNDLGEYRIFALAPGRYYLSATAMSPGFLAGPGAVLTVTQAAPGGPPVEQAYAPTYFPGVVDAAQAGTLEVGAGAELRSVDFRLLKVPTVRIRGRVLNTLATRPGRGTMVHLSARGLSYIGRGLNQVNSEDGTFELRGVTPGSYHLTAYWSDGEQAYSAVQPLEVGNANIEGVELVLSRGAEIRGQMRLEGPAEAALTEVRVGLRPAENFPMMGPPATGGKVEADGSFLLRNVNPGAYRVFVYGASEELYLKSARLGDADALASGVTVLPGQGSLRLEVVASAASARVEGTVTDEQGQPVTGLQVCLIPEAGRRSQTQLFKIAPTDQNGRFQLRGVAPGEYKLFAWEDLEMGAHQDPEFLKQHEEKGKSVTVREGSVETTTLKLIPASASGGTAR